MKISRDHLNSVLHPATPVIGGLDEGALFDFVTSVRPGDAPEVEMRRYGSNDFKRFLYTYSLLPVAEKARLLEFGSNPYFMTMLIKEFTSYDVHMCNYFSKNFTGIEAQEVHYRDPYDKTPKAQLLQYRHFNLEEGLFPLRHDYYDVVMLCEIIEHLLKNPLLVLLKIG